MSSAPATALPHRGPRSRPARVLFVHNSAQIGGGNRVLLTLLERLPRDRFAPLSLVPRRGPLTAELDRRGVPSLCWDILTPWRAGSTARQAAALLGLVLLVRWRRVDLLHANGPLSYRLSSLAVGGAARLCHLQSPPESEALRWAFQRPPHLLVACSEAVRRQAEEMLGPGEAPASITVPNPVDCAHWNEPAGGDRSPSLPEHDALLLFCGSLGERKGIDDFLQLAARVLVTRPRALFVIAGEDLTGDGAYRRRMEQLAVTMGLGDRALFTGFLDDPRALMQAATLVVLPSRSEGMPLALLEAAACGKPVIAYRIPGVDEVVVDGINGRLVPVGDVGALTAVRAGAARQRRARGHDGPSRPPTGRDAARRPRLRPANRRAVRDPVAGPADGFGERPPMSGDRDAAASWSERYRDRRVVERYVADRFTTPLGALLHERQTAVVRRTLLARNARRVVEVAAGPARFLPELARHDARCVFVDLSLPMLRAARGAAAAGAMPIAPAWVAADAAILPLRDGAFDLALAFRFLRHVDDSARMRIYDELARVVAPGGALLFDAVNERVSAPVRRAAPDDHPLPDRLYRETDLRAEIAATRFEIESLTPVQRRYPLERRLQILIAPRSRRLASWLIGLVERSGGEPLEWVVVCRRV